MQQGGVAIILFNLSVRMVIRTCLLISNSQHIHHNSPIAISVDSITVTCP